jgi:hypothetical protein
MKREVARDTDSHVLPHDGSSFGEDSDTSLPLLGIRVLCFVSDEVIIGYTDEIGGER